MTFAELDKFLKYIQLEKNFSVHTVREYEFDLMGFLNFLKSEGISNLEEVEYIHARLYVTKLYDEKKARTSISRKISAIRSFFKYLNREFNLDDSSFRSLYHPKKEKRLPNFFYEEELSLLFEKNIGTDDKAVRNMA
ncbi:MAG TPA: site-specific integrase, partial [Ureibacillus sp.]|nr:site-specific integrase [Ureibacillus sp.]